MRASDCIFNSVFYAVRLKKSCDLLEHEPKTENSNYSISIDQKHAKT